MVAMMPAAEMAQIEKTTFSRKVRRVFGLGLHSWEQLMLLSLGIAALAALALVVATTSVVILQRDETARTKNEFESYKLEAGKTISEADARTKEAELKLEQLRDEVRKRELPREVSRDKFVKAIEGAPKATVEVLYDQNAPDAYFVASLIWGFLFNENWDVEPKSSPMAPDANDPLPTSRSPHIA
jgi:hypothetical protein